MLNIPEVVSSRCNALVYGSLVATVIHSSGRITQQTWGLCKEHFPMVLSLDPTKFTRVYRNGKVVNVLKFRELIEI